MGKCLRTKRRVASCVNTTTSHLPIAGWVGIINSGGVSALNSKEGKRLIKTAIRQSPCGNSVGKSGLMVTANGLYSGDGKNVRFCRCAA